MGSNHEDDSEEGQNGQISSNNLWLFEFESQHTAFVLSKFGLADLNLQYSRNNKSVFAYLFSLVLALLVFQKVATLILSFTGTP
jgi:hypothetical protein